jgi:hypothetical protein
MLSTAAAVVGNFYDLPKELVCLSLARAYQPHRRSRRDGARPPAKNLLERKYRGWNTVGRRGRETLTVKTIFAAPGISRRIPPIEDVTPRAACLNGSIEAISAHGAGRHYG